MNKKYNKRLTIATIILVLVIFVGVFTYYKQKQYATTEQLYAKQNSSENIEKQKQTDEEAKKKADEDLVKQKQADEDAKKKAEEEAKKVTEDAKKADENKTVKNTTSPAPTKPSTSGSTTTTKPSSATTAPKPTTSTKTTPTAPTAPARASGIDEELTKKLNDDAQSIIKWQLIGTDNRTNTMIKSARSVAFGGDVDPSIKEKWLLDSTWNLYTRCIGHEINVVVGEKEFYYTRLPKRPRDGSYFEYIIAYWDASINNYKLYYVILEMEESNK